MKVAQSTVSCYYIPRHKSYLRELIAEYKYHAKQQGKTDIQVIRHGSDIYNPTNKTATICIKRASNNEYQVFMNYWKVIKQVRI